MVDVDLPSSKAPSGAWQVVKFGPGVVGRTTTVAVAFIVLLIVAIYAAAGNAWLVGGIVLLGFVATAAFISKAFSFAEKHPHHAVTEGGELVRIHEIEQSAKRPEIIDLEAEPIANTNPPNAITGPTDA